MPIRLIKTIRGFTEGSRFDWLHPSNGPFPDFAADYEDTENGEKFEVLAWDDKVSWVTIVIGPDWYHSGYPYSYRWWPDSSNPTMIWCRPNRSNICKVDIDQNPNILRQIAGASIYVHILLEPCPNGQG